MPSSSSSEAASEFSINRRTKRADPSCSICSGQGEIERQITENVPYTCAQCGGHGYVAAPNSRTGRTTSCLHCEGSGTRWHPRTVTRWFKCDCLS
ncbi:hypothetical protein BDV96DRAFT_562184 [Lophiotrema nucula]|uniref:CR-type domain-containing protein n=1 Tax=Lophiotrema nucula TaxID=690887 RepID=A0A6A5ZWJ0_9PLEO|nr:hypothetical protein BDV96DRAFT_562184 [Lophiotrema nucula]